MYFRNWNLRKKIELEILKSGLSDDLLRGYRDICLNPFTSGVSAVLSTKGTRTQYLSHGSFDVFRYTNFYYHAIKLWIRTGILPKKCYSCFWDGQPKTERKKTRNIFDLNKSSLNLTTDVNFQYSPDILNDKIFRLQNERVLILLWTQRDAGSNRDFNKQIIQFNLDLVHAFFERHPYELGKLVCLIKCYRHFDREGFELFQKHLREFESYFTRVVFFNDISTSSFMNHIPVELLVDALSPAYMVGSSLANSGIVLGAKD